MNRELKIILEKNQTALENSTLDFQALYTITFSQNGIMAEDTDGFRIVEHTYVQVKERIEEASCALYNKIGAKHSFVALEMENCVDWIVAFWSILRSGNKPYLVNCRHPKSLADSALKRLGIEYCIGKEKSGLNAEFIDITTLRTEKRFDGEFENEIALSTSATTLKEVICFYTGAQLSSQILNVKNFIKKYPEISKQYKGRIKNLAFLPFYHIFGLIAVYFWFTFFGQTIVFLKNMAPDTILQTCRKHNVTHVFAVPLLWHTIENAVLKKVRESGKNKEKKLRKGQKLCTALQNLFPHTGMYISQKIMHEVTDELFGRSIRFCINGGSYIRRSAMELMNSIGYNLHNGYGMSEIGITSVDFRTRPKHKNLSSVGAPLDSVEYKLDQDGILNVRGSSICSKLWINGEEKSTDGWFSTGDIMEIIDGYYYIKGRLGDVIIGENGENLNPDIIEQNFAVPEAENICVIGMKENGRTIVSMIVQISKYLSSAKRNNLISRLQTINDTLPITSRVQKFYFTTDALCSPSAVKVSRNFVNMALETKSITLTDFKKESIDASTECTYTKELLDRVTQIVANALEIDIESIDINAHIMLDLGADSIVYFSILSDLAEEFSVKATEKDVLCYTIHDICQYIERHI